MSHLLTELKKHASAMCDAALTMQSKAHEIHSQKLMFDRSWQAIRDLLRKHRGVDELRLASGDAGELELNQLLRVIGDRSAFADANKTVDLPARVAKRLKPILDRVPADAPMLPDEAA